jgi:hypothetical protein
MQVKTLNYFSFILPYSRMKNIRGADEEGGLGSARERKSV